MRTSELFVAKLKEFLKFMVVRIGKGVKANGVTRGLIQGGSKLGEGPTNRHSSMIGRNCYDAEKSEPVAFAIGCLAQSLK